MEYQESRHTVLELLGRVNAKVQSWKAPYTSMETVCLLLQDWHVSSYERAVKPLYTTSTSTAGAVYDQMLCHGHRDQDIVSLMKQSELVQSSK